MEKVDVCVIGSANMDLVARVPHMLQAGETLLALAYHEGFGGKGANQAVMAARLGSATQMIAKLGQDAYGERLKENFSAQGVGVDYVFTDDAAPTGRALINTAQDTGDNSITVVAGANRALSPADVEAARGVIEAAQVVVAQLETPQETTLAAFKIAKAAHKTTILNPAPAAALSDELLRYCDYLIPNEREAAQLAGIDAPFAEAEARILSELTARAASLVVTLGDKGVVFVTEGGAGGAANVADGVAESVQRLPAIKVKAVDTTGAGDAFVGAFAHYLAAGNAPTEALTRAVKVAAYSVQRVGAQRSYPTAADVL